MRCTSTSSAGSSSTSRRRQLLRQHFRGPLYADLHSLVLAVQPDGLRTLQPLPDVAAWCRCFDIIQVNENEMAMMAPDPMALAATALANNVRCLCVTLAGKGAVLLCRTRLRASGGPPRRAPRSAPALGPIRTALVPAPATLAAGDPTGCGDVWGATYFSRLLAGDNLTAAMRTAHEAAARNVDHRGATGLAGYLRGELSSR